LRNCGIAHCPSSRDRGDHPAAIGAQRRLGQHRLRYTRKAPNLGHRKPMDMVERMEHCGKRPFRDSHEEAAFRNRRSVPTGHSPLIAVAGLGTPPGGRAGPVLDQPRHPTCRRARPLPVFLPPGITLEPNSRFETSGVIGGGRSSHRCPL